MKHQHNDPREVLTAEASRVRAVYLRANKDRPGPEPEFDNFMIEAGADLGIDASDFTSASGDWKTRYEAWQRGAGYRRMKYEYGLSGKYLEWKSPFMKAVAAVMAARENGPGGRPPKRSMPSDRELMRIFRPPGKKNCSRQDFEKFRKAIFELAADLTSTRAPASDE